MWGRRAFLIGAGCAAGVGLGLLHRARGGASTAAAIRPPGAQREPDFLAACIRCGQCVEACPYDTLQLTGLAAGLGAGTPFLEPRAVPCYLCADHEELLCIAACPTDALRPVERVEDIAMGVAVIDEENCLAHNGVVCRACWHVCPVSDDAIVFDERLRPRVSAEACIGCGLCDHACLTDPSSITVKPPDPEAAPS